MSDLSSLHNAADLSEALQRGALSRCEVGALELPPTSVGLAGQRHTWRSVRMTGTKLVGLQIQSLDAAQWLARGVLLRAFRAEHARLTSCHWQSCQAQESHWSESWFAQCSWEETALTNARFGRAVLTDCRFAQTDLNHVQWTEAALLNCQFADSRQGGAVLDNANLSGAVLCQVDLRGANLFRASFAGAVLVGVDLRGANLTAASFRDAVLVDCLLDGADRAAETEAELRAAEGGPAQVLARLQGLPQPILALVATSLLLRPAAGGVAANTAGPSRTHADPLQELLQQPFAGLIRNLQGRGGPAELGQLRVDGDHVFARGVSGEEVRLTNAGRAPARVAPVMRDPPAAGAGFGSQPLPPAPAAAPAAPVRPAAPPPAQPGGLEID